MKGILDSFFRKPAALSAINALLSRGQVSAALDKADELIALDPSAGESYRVRAQIRYALKDHDGALRDIDESLNRDDHPSNVAMCLTLRGMIRAQGGEAALAFADFSRAISTSPAHSNDAFTYRGQLYLQQNEFEKALEDFSTALRFEIHTSMGRRAELHRLRAEVYLRLGDRARAAEDYMRAHGYNPRSHDINIKAAELLMERGDFGMAINVLNNALRYDPTRASTYNPMLDRAYRAAGMTRPTASTPQQQPALRDRSRHPLAQLDEQPAQPLEAPASLDLEPATPAPAVGDAPLRSPMSARAYQRAMQGDLHGALEDVDAALRAFPYSVPDLILRGNICYGLKKYDGALASFRTAKNIRGDEEGIRAALAGEALTLYTLGDVDDARESWAELVTYAPDFADLNVAQEKLKWADQSMDQIRAMLA